ncbi:hypothetical protein BK049_03120 [Bacillus xiamenensis]|uniref:Uncharacterized protein n=1 Tax=Bacillus xiamenensis TaxID=1178537 RepID=A0AAC9NA26_9BACI|nr:hypothetical protein BK049_03120 [Bacillus xiamenensis]EKF35139.1 hypothetical protein BA1_11649 [Bacillus xiamenensis]MBG9912955.1 hypothetical protein [Bacillus xiamenensis]
MEHQKNETRRSLIKESFLFIEKGFFYEKLDIRNPKRYILSRDAEKGMLGRNDLQTKEEMPNDN